MHSAIKHPRAPLPLVALIEKREFEFVFQPIFDANGVGVYGCEALCRLPSRLHPAGPLELFEAADAAGLSDTLDLTLVEMAVERHAQLRLAGHLFLNVLPQTLVGPESLAVLIARLLQRHALKASDLVIEITEHGLQLDPSHLEAGVRPLRELGCQIAIDDLGAGASGLKTWSVLRPDVVKLDRYFAAQVGQDDVGAEVLRSLLDIAHVMGSRVVAEGIETREQCDALQALGVDYLQGYFLARPQAEPRVEASATGTMRGLQPAENCAEALLVEREPVAPDTRVADAVALFQQHPDWHSLAVCAGGRAVGVIRRDHLLTLLSKPLYPEIYNRKPVERVMDPEPVVVDARARLEQVSRMVTAARATRIHEDFLIARHGRYAGLGRTIDLLQQITTLQIETAQQSNPLTLLPGNREIDAQLSRVLALRVPFVMAHADIDHFKAYNDAYGYRAGDQVLLHLADVLRAAVDPAVDFVGHVGGDDFILLLRSTDWRRRVHGVFDTFGASVDNWYSAEHRRERCIVTADRDGQPREFPLMTLSVGAVSSNGTRFAQAAEVTGSLQRVKSGAKAQKGDALVVDSGEGVKQACKIHG